MNNYDLETSLGGLILFNFQGGAQHPLGHENSLKSIDFKSIDFTGPGGGLAPIAPPPTLLINISLLKVREFCGFTYKFILILFNLCLFSFRFSIKKMDWLRISFCYEMSRKPRKV